MLDQIPEGKQVVICIGDADSGKTSFVRDVVTELRRHTRPVVHMDLDMGQSTIGPPTTIGLSDPVGVQHLYFVGNTSPHGIIKEIRKGLAALRHILDAHSDAIAIADTAGLISGPFGWYLKRLEIDHLRADFAVVFDRQGESSGIVAGLRRLGIDHTVLKTRGEVGRKSPAARFRYRRLLFEEYFRNASVIRLATTNRNITTLGKPPEQGTLAGLLHQSGFLVCLALFVSWSDPCIDILAPPCTLSKVTTVKFGKYALKEK